MDLPAILTSAALSVLLILLTRWLWHIYILSLRDRASPLPLPPGDMGWPLIGETVHFLVGFATGTDFFSQRRRKFGLVYKTHLLGKPTVRLTGAENIKPVLLGEHHLVSSQWPRAVKTLFGSGTLAMSNGENHRNRRKLVLQAFSHEALMSYVEPIQHTIDETLTSWCDVTRVPDIIEATGKLAINLAMEVLVGLGGTSAVAKETMARNFQDILGGFFTPGFAIPGTRFHKALKARANVLKELQVIMESKESCSSSCTDAMSHVYNAHLDAGVPVAPSEVATLMMEFLLAGWSTLQSSMASVVIQLAKNKDVKDNVLKELSQLNLSTNTQEEKLTLNCLSQMSYTSNVVKEVLRLGPPAGGGYRKALKTLEIGGFQIPKGWTLIYSIKDTHDTTELFSEADKFDPSRWSALEDERLANFHVLPFGAGPRACAGKGYANLVLKVFTVELVRMCKWKLEKNNFKMIRLPTWRPAEPLPVNFMVHDEGQMAKERTSTDPEVRHRPTLGTDH